ncbi:PadR family transcriptional regulator [Candidatus Saccharibacteria bacterium]|jgi:PadR family transcriptional regulator PadR|nr:PadR family transcriptional regulator [Candidatus Saccharibacteria bacterium]
MKDYSGESKSYALGLATQLRKGFLAYCALKICSYQSRYTSDIIQQLKDADLVVVEGTIYPLLSRLHKDGLLTYEWKESEQGPPRKYYKTTKFGHEVVDLMAEDIAKLNETLNRL